MQQLEIEHGVGVTSARIENAEWTNNGRRAGKATESERGQVDLLHGFGDSAVHFGKQV